MRFFFKNQVIISRLKQVSNNLKSYQSTGTAEANVQQLSDSRGQLGGGPFGKQFKIWCPLGTDIREGDKLTDENGVRYDCREIKTVQFGAFDYIEAIVIKSEGPND